MTTVTPPPPRDSFERRGFDNYGRAVAVGGGIAVVGSPGSDDVTTAAGTAFVFDATTGSELAKLMPFTLDADGSNVGAAFGRAVDVSADHVVVGAPGSITDDISGQGAADILTTNRFRVVERISPSDGAFADNFGTSVAVHGDIDLHADQPLGLIRRRSGTGTSSRPSTTPSTRQPIRSATRSAH